MTREEIIDEMGEVRRDLAAFLESRDALQRRISEMDSRPKRRELFTEWAATQALMNVLVMAVTRCEGLLEDYRSALDRMDAPDNLVRFVRET